MKALLMSLAIVFLAACGTDEQTKAPPVLAECCDGLVSTNPEAVLMCKYDATKQNSQTLVRRDATGMIQTMQELKYSTCE